MSAIVIALPGNEALAGVLAQHLKAGLGTAAIHRFPDEESLVRLDCDVSGRTIVLVASLDRPDPKFLPLLSAATTTRELGASKVGLIAPYLAYMRQDQRFHPGEAVTSRLFARQLSDVVDWLVTVDPHLHRVKALADIFSTPAIAVHAASLLARWIAEHVDRPVLIGPDRESEQWVSEVAAGARAPFLVLEKQRSGDFDVRVSLPDLDRYRDRTPVLVDDIISTGRTMVGALQHLAARGAKPAVCAGVHAVFAPGALEALRAAGAERIVTANTIAHETNGIDVAPLLADAARKLV
jgi:ribose-phosphate pyrophosphokinase